MMSSPSATSIKSIKGGKGKIKTTWSKKSGVSGYKVQISRYKNFSYASTIDVKKASKTSLTATNLYWNTRYYVRVCTYKTVGDDQICSKWSSKRSVKTTR